MDCFAYSKKGCSALLVKSCLSDKCRFHKTPEQAEADRRHSAARIALLDDTKRTHIASTYYGGKLPKPEVTA